MGKKKRYLMPGSLGGLFVLSPEKYEGIVIKPKEVLLLAILLVVLVWVLRIIF